MAPASLSHYLPDYQLYPQLRDSTAEAWQAYVAWPGFQDFLSNDDGIGITETMSDEYDYIEEGREFGGVAISTIALLVMLFHSFTVKSKKD